MKMGIKVQKYILIGTNKFYVVDSPVESIDRGTLLYCTVNRKETYHWGMQSLGYF